MKGSSLASACAWPDCKAPVFVRSRGLCRAHYDRARALGVLDERFPKPGVGHGTDARYQRGCRCNQCRAAHSQRVRLGAKRRLAEGRVTHGTLGAYVTGCRCDHCRAANSQYQRRHRADLPRQAETVPTARRHGYQWTGPELEIANRKDLSVLEVARLLGRTYYATRTMRTLINRGDDPRITNRL